MKVANKILEALTSKETKELQNAIVDAFKFDGIDFFGIDLEVYSKLDDGGPDTLKGYVNVKEMVFAIKDLADDEHIEASNKDIEKALPKILGSLKGMSIKKVSIDRDTTGDVKITKINQKGKVIHMDLDVTSFEGR
jgi:hypothetical protein